MSKQMTWIGNGPIYFGDYDPVNGTAAMGYLVNVRRIGCMNSSLTTTPATEQGEIKESCSGSRATAKIYDKSKELSVKIAMFQFDRSILANAFFGNGSLVASGTVTEEALPTLNDEDIAVLRHTDASSIVLTDSTEGTPVTLTLNTHYAVESAKQGLLKMLDLDGLTQPIKAAYEHAAYGNIAALAASRVIKGMVFAGQNDEGDIARIMIPQMSLSLSGDFDWLSEEPAELQLEGKALYSSALDSAADFGGFMRISGLSA